MGQLGKTIGTYACAGCCPDSFFTGWLTPSEVYSFPGDETQFTALRQSQTCYGELTEPFETFANFSCLDSNVAFCGSNGLTTAQNPGNTTISGGFGRVFFYEPNHDSGTCNTAFANFLTGAVYNVLGLQAHRGRIQAQGTNPRVEESSAWSQDNPTSKEDGLFRLNAVWNRLTASQKRDRQRAYEGARRFIEDAPQDGYEAFPNRISRSFRDPARRDPDARIDIEIITGRAFVGPF